MLYPSFDYPFPSVSQEHIEIETKNLAKFVIKMLLWLSFSAIIKPKLIYTLWTNVEQVQLPGS